MTTPGDSIFAPQNERLRQVRRAIDSRHQQAEPPPELLHRRRLAPWHSLTQLWEYRRIVRTLAERNLRVRYKQSWLGFTWAVLTPIALLVVLTIVFQRGVGVSTGGTPYPLFAFVGLIPWTFFAASITTGGVSVLSDKALLNKARFPREVFPLSSIVVAAVDSAMTMVPLALIFLWFQHPLSWHLVMVLAPLAVLVVATVGATLLVSAWVVYVRDVRLVLPLVVQVGLFATPVAYDISLVPDGLRPAYALLNPVAPVIDALRRTALLGESPAWSELGLATASGTVLLLVGYAVFKRLDGGFADVA